MSCTEAVNGVGSELGFVRVMVIVPDSPWMIGLGKNDFSTVGGLCALTAPVAIMEIAQICARRNVCGECMTSPFTR